MSKNYWGDTLKNLPAHYIQYAIATSQQARKDFDAAYALLTEEEKERVDEIISHKAACSPVIGPHKKSDAIQSSRSKQGVRVGLPRKIK